MLIGNAHFTPTIATPLLLHYGAVGLTIITIVEFLFHRREPKCSCNKGRSNNCWLPYSCVIIEVTLNKSGVLLQDNATTDKTVGKLDEEGRTVMENSNKNRFHPRLNTYKPIVLYEEGFAFTEEEVSLPS